MSFLTDHHSTLLSILLSPSFSSSIYSPASLPALVFLRFAYSASNYHRPCFISLLNIATFPGFLTVQPINTYSLRDCKSHRVFTWRPHNNCYCETATKYIFLCFYQLPFQSVSFRTCFASSAMLWLQFRCHPFYTQHTSRCRA